MKTYLVICVSSGIIKVKATGFNASSSGGLFYFHDEGGAVIASFPIDKVVGVIEETHKVSSEAK